jgi:LGFP repeat
MPINSQTNVQDRLKLDTHPPFPLSPLITAGIQINAKYRQLGGASGILGQPVTVLSPIASSPNGLGYFIHYQGGSIYWSAHTGAHEVQGSIQEKWASLGWEQSFLGYPVTDETKTPDGVGRYNHFQGGSIYWSPSTAAFVVHGAIRDKWASLGWEKSFLGYPLTDESGTPDGFGRFNHFQGGSIYWTPSTGAHEVHGAIRDKWAAMGWERSFLGYPTSDELADPGGRVSHFQHGDITWSTGKGAVVSPETQHFHSDVTTQDWAPLGGTIDVVMNILGNYTFTGHMHDSGFPNIDYTLGVIIMTPSGIGFSLSHTGHLDGTITIFSRHRDDDWTDTNVNPEFQKNWDQIRQGRLFWRLVANDTLSKGVLGLLQQIAEDAAKQVATAGVTALIALA